jgi:excisionase family DNA binding protein
MMGGHGFTETVRDVGVSDMGEPFKKQWTVWKLDGKSVRPGTPGAERVKRMSRKWYGTVGGRQVPLSRDKAASQKMLNKLLADVDLASVGLADPYAEHRRRPLAEHLKDYAHALEAKGDTDEHVRLTLGRLRSLFEGCGFVYPDDVDPARASEWLHGLRRPGAARRSLPAGKKSYTPAEVAELLGISGAALRAAVRRLGLRAEGKGRARRLPRAAVQTLLGRSTQGASPRAHAL